jgi:hypothetical protein
VLLSKSSGIAGQTRRRRAGHRLTAACDQVSAWLGRRATVLIDAAAADLLMDPASSGPKFREALCGVAVLTGFAAMMHAVTVIHRPTCRELPLLLSSLSEIPEFLVRIAGPRAKRS